MIYCPSSWCRRDAGTGNTLLLLIFSPVAVPAMLRGLVSLPWPPAQPSSFNLFSVLFFFSSLQWGRPHQRPFPYLLSVFGVGSQIHARRRQCSDSETSRSSLGGIVQQKEASGTSPLAPLQIHNVPTSHRRHCSSRADLWRDWLAIGQRLVSDWSASWTTVFGQGAW